jgi:hypothetical protein
LALLHNSTSVAKECLSSWFYSPNLLVHFATVTIFRNSPLLIVMQQGQLDWESSYNEFLSYWIPSQYPVKLGTMAGDDGFIGRLEIDLGSVT